MRLAGIYTNGEVCGLIRQYTWNLTNCPNYKHLLDDR